MATNRAQVSQVMARYHRAVMCTPATTPALVAVMGNGQAMVVPLFLYIWVKKGQSPLSRFVEGSDVTITFTAFKSGDPRGLDMVFMKVDAKGGSEMYDVVFPMPECKAALEQAAKWGAVAFEQGPGVRPQTPVLDIPQDALNDILQAWR